MLSGFKGFSFSSELLHLQMLEAKIVYTVRVSVVKGSQTGGLEGPNNTSRVVDASLPTHGWCDLYLC
jgi:hypothetical protein